MSTSDNDLPMTWQPWRPVNLLADGDIAMLPPFPNVEGGNTIDEVALQAECTRLRQQAEKKGFEQGQAQGYEKGKKDGFEVGREEGRQEGQEQGKQEMIAQQEEITARLNLLMHNMQDALDSLDYVIPSRLIQLALSAARSLLGTAAIGEMSTTLLQERIQQLLHDEPLFKDETRLWVSEQDKPLIERHFSQTLAARGWLLSVDENMLPGGCRITSEEMELDESLEMRWKMLCSSGCEEHWR
ncbi:flagellar assembly protein FliH [Serratia fonticola]|uniref:flagellar assembly protein FliH n=1 Tax=Serratia fonticola TaxID=47917 RepID=UPI000419A77E|nr:flagellar assembly protein FliH [Serratia fonticola]